MGDHVEVMKALSSKQRHQVTYSVLTPNLKGLKSALECGAQEVAIFGAVSETFTQKNINCSIAESLKRFEDVAKEALEAKVKLRGYVSCVVGCPYEGPIDPKQVTLVSQALLDMGCYEVSLGDTIGVGTAGTVSKLLDEVASKIPVDRLAIHCHDTYGQALSNILLGNLKSFKIDILVCHLFNIFSSKLWNLSGGCQRRRPRRLPLRKRCFGQCCY